MAFHVNKVFSLDLSLHTEEDIQKLEQAIRVIEDIRHKEIVINPHKLRDSLLGGGNRDEVGNLKRDAKFYIGELYWRS